MKAILILILIINTLNIWGQSPGSGNTLNFDGANDVVVCGNHINVTDLGAGSLTIEAWVYPTNLTGIHSIIRKTGDYNLYLNGNKVSAEIWTTAGINNDWTLINAAATVPLNEWSHIAFTNNGAIPKIYLNGVSATTSTSNGNIPDNNSQLNIGFSTVYGQCFSGNIDEVRIWNTERSQTEIRDNMCSKLIGTETGLVAYYRFDDGIGTTLTDETGTQNGTLTNMAPASDWITSGAPIGDASLHDYAVTAATSLNIASPLGDDLTANVTALTTTPNSIHIYRVDQEPNDNTPPGSQNQLSQVVYYGVKVFGGTGVTYTVVYDYDGHSGIIDENDLELAKRDNNADSWSQEAATLNAIANTLTLAGQTGAEYILGSVGEDPLPIVLLSFKVMVNESKVYLNWQTASEINNDFFTIERSKDGINWEIIEKIKGAGNSSTILSYSGIDKNPYRGISYYRLKQTDFDGYFEYSQIRSVNIDELMDSQIQIYLNPAENKINIIGDVSELKQLKIYNTLGQDVTGLIVIINKSDTSLIIDLSNLRKGMYLIKTKTTACKFSK